MLRSLFSGVSGLKTHQTKMDVIGNNIANVNTAAYKSSSVTFSEIMYQTVQKASGANALTGTGGTNAKQIGLGVTTGAINANMTQGFSQTTGNPFDLKITGDSFFVVNNGTSNYFTRAGAFFVDGAGNLAMTSTGYNVMGWQVDDNTGEIIKDTVSPLTIMAEKNLTAAPEATSLGTVAGILDENDTNLTSANGKVMNLSVIDKLGYSYTLKMSIVPTYNAKTSTKTVMNSSTDYKLPASIKKVSTTSYSYASDDGSITSINIPAAMKAELDDYVAKAAGPVTSIVLGTDFTPTGLEKSDPLYGKTLKVTSQTTTTYEVAGQPINVDEPLILELYKVDGGDPELYNLKPGISVIKQEKAYLDGSASDYTYTIFDSGAETHTDLVNTDNIGNLLAASSGTVLSNYTSTEDVTETEMVRGQYEVRITDMINSITKESVKIDALGKSSYNLVYSTVDGTFSYIGANGEDSISVNLSAIDQRFGDLEIDFSQTSNQNKKETSTISASAGYAKKLGAGRELGALIGISISNNGMIHGTYDNGGNKLLGQIATATFANASGLSKEGENLYAATLNSGEFDGIGQDITADGGSMSTGVLEMSNVDLSSEFTEMITTQRGFQANSRIITTSDTLLEELINLKR